MHVSYEKDASLSIEIVFYIYIYETDFQRCISYFLNILNGSKRIRLTTNFP